MGSPPPPGPHPGGVAPPPHLARRATPPSLDLADVIADGTVEKHKGKRRKKAGALPEAVPPLPPQPSQLVPRLQLQLDLILPRLQEILIREAAANPQGTVTETALTRIAMAELPSSRAYVNAGLRCLFEREALQFIQLKRSKVLRPVLPAT